ncbi:MAG: beta-galactosidase [Syntrophothermus sp.]
MSRRLSALLALVCLGGAVAATPGASARPLPTPPPGFFGIAPQAGLTVADVSYMKAGGIESIRWPLSWSSIQPTRKGGYDWSGFDQAVEVAARAGLSILPSINSTPRWVAAKETTMPIDTARQRAAWTAFLRAAVERYGPGGEFWTERGQERRIEGPEGVTYVPAIPAAEPIRAWQIWNESNFFYFAYPVSPSRYGKLVTISSQAIKSVSPGARVILSGLFGKPTAGGRRGMPAATFLRQLYRYPGIKSRFDGVSLHPYAVDSEMLEELVEEFHEVLVENHDRPAFYITEMGWGSQSNFQHDAFEQGPQGQARELRSSYEFLLANQRRLNLRGVYWFSWRDLAGSCDFCDSVGFFREGKRFQPKPAWRVFVRLSGGRPRP